MKQLDLSELLEGGENHEAPKQADIPKERLEVYLKIAKALPPKPSKWELENLRDEVFSKMTRRLNKVDDSDKFKILHKFFNEIKGGGGNYHKKFIEAIDRANWRVNVILQEEREYRSMMSAELDRILDED